MDEAKAAGEERAFPYRVLDEIAEQMVGAYASMLGELNESIAGVLKRAHGVSKSGSLFIGRRSTAEDLILKAVKPAKKAGKAAKTAAPKANAPKAKAPKEKPGEIKNPGAHGGKWWRDKNGHVRYGKRPVDEGGQRKWKEMADEDVKNLYQNMTAVYDFSPKLTRLLDEEMCKMGYDTGVLSNIIRDSALQGVSPEDFFTEAVVAGGKDEDDAHDAWSQLLEAYRAAITNDKFKKAAKDAIKERQNIELALDHRLNAVAKYSDGAYKDFMRGDPKHVAVKLLALMNDLGAIFIPHSQSELGEDEKVIEDGDDKRAVMKKLGRISPNGARLEMIVRRAERLTPEQFFATFIGERLAEMADATGDEAQEIAWKQGDEWSDVALAGTRAEFMGHMQQALAKVLGEDDLSDDEWNDHVQRLNEIGSYVHDLINAYNDDSGGDVVGELMSGAYPTPKLFKDPKAVEELQKQIEEKQATLKAAVEAQGDASFETPDAMKPAFKKLTEVLQKQGRLEAGKEADLMDFQKQAVNWMTTIKRGILGYDTGMGKTPITIATMAHLMETGKTKRGILVLPKGLVKQWPKELKKFFPGKKVVAMGEGLSLDDRIEMLEAIQSGKIDADFVVMSASTVDLMPGTRERLKSEVMDYNEESGEWSLKDGMTEEMKNEKMTELLGTDRLSQALRNLEGTVLFDEAHHASQGLKNPNNMHHIVAKEFLKGREYSYLMTATPMPNGSPKELFHMMDLIHPGSAGPDVKRFENKICKWERVPDSTGKAKWQQVANDGEWEGASKSIQPYVFMKKKTDEDVVAANKKAGMVLPPLDSKTHTLLVPKEMEPLIEEAGNIHPIDPETGKPKEDWAPFGDDEGGLRLRKLMQVQQLSVTPKILLGDTYKGPQPKLEHLADLVKKHFSDPKNADKPIVVFSRFPSAFKYAREVLGKEGVDQSLIGEIHGGVKNADRDVVQEATNAGKLKICFVGIEAGGAGLNLQAASNKMIFLDQPWSPAHKDQALGRVHRTGQTDTTEAINLKLNMDIDESKLASLAKKISTTETLSYAKDGGEIATRITLAQIARMLGGEDAIDRKPDAVVQADLDKLGLKGVLTADVLKQNLNIGQFKDTVQFKDYLQFGDEEVETKRQLNLARFKNGKYGKDEYERIERKLDGDASKWKEAAYRAGKLPISEWKSEKARQPEASYVVTSDKKPSAKISPEARKLFDTMKRDKGAFTVSDYMNDHVLPEVAKEHAKRNKVKDDDARVEVAAQWDKPSVRNEVQQRVKDAFKELHEAGYVSRKDPEHVNDDAELPKAKPSKVTTKVKGSAPPKNGGAAKPAKKPAAPVKPAKRPSKPSMEGGWTYKLDGAKVKGDARKVVAHLQTLKRKPKTFDDFRAMFGDGKPAEVAARRFIKELHAAGAMES